MRSFHLMAATSALALCAANTDAGAAQAPPAAPPAEPAADPVVQAPAIAPNADPSPPSEPEKTKKAAKAARVRAGFTAIVWAQPGHEKLGIGQLLATPTAEAEALRAAGRARFAAEAEILAAKGDIPEVEGL